MTQTLKRDENADGIQGFAPRLISDIANGSTDTSTWLAYCFPNDDVTYQINGAGSTATLRAGSIRVRNDTISTITFSGIATTIPCEIM